MPSRLANSWSDRARPLTSSSTHARPGAIALISAGSHLELCFCGANPGRTNLVSVPRRVKAAVAVSSTALSLAASDMDDATCAPNRRPRRSLMMIVFSSTMIFSTSSPTSFAIYARVSSDKQKEENTIASQTAALTAFAGEQGYAVPTEWIFVVPPAEADRGLDAQML